MDQMRDLISQITKDWRYKILRKLIAGKLKKSQAIYSEELVDALTAHVCAGNTERFFWPSDVEGEDIDIKLEFTDEDIQEIETLVTKAIEAIPDAITAGLNASAEGLFEELRKRWIDEHLLQKFEIDDFRGRLEVRWEEGLSLLRMLLTCCREIGNETFQSHAKSKSNRYKFRRWVMLRLHTRACQVTDEIICLLENGFADGAMARWRTLYELSVVAVLIAEGDELLAERYINHDIVEVKRQADFFDSEQATLGEPGIKPNARKDINRQYEKAIARFGPNFAHSYGWAAQRVKCKKPTFKDLQQEADRLAMGSHYKIASFNVHASARSLFFNLSSVGPRMTLSAGRSNAGLDEAGTRTAHTIVLITSLYSKRQRNSESIIMAKTLLCIRDAAVSAFERTSRRLSREVRELENEERRCTRPVPKKSKPATPARPARAHSIKPRRKS